MPRYKLPLKAGIASRAEYGGQMLQVVSTGAASSVTLQVELGSRDQTEDLGDVVSKFRMVSQAERITGLTLTSAIDTTVDLFISDQNITLADTSGSSVVASIDPTQLPLSVDNKNDHAAETVTYPGAVNVSNAGSGTLLLAGSAAYRRAVFYNAGANPVAIYRGAATPNMFTAAAIILQPGGAYIEEKYAGNGQAFRGMANGAASSVQIEVFQ
jgi:hypothetical protein